MNTTKPKQRRFGPRHIKESLRVIEDEIDQSKQRHPSGASEHRDPHPVKEHRGEGWERIFPGVIYFERNQAG
jgi:hypothetical protein